jgi:NitT/TauT family transport system substrate-binding protein
MARLSLSIALVLLVLAASGAGDLAAQAPPPQKVVFALNWFPVGDHAAYWVALE